MLTDSQLAEAEGVLTDIGILQARCRRADLGFLVYLFNIAGLHIEEERFAREEFDRVHRPVSIPTRAASKKRGKGGLPVSLTHVS